MTTNRYKPDAGASDATRTMQSVNETHFAEIEKVLLYISEARRRAEKTAKTIGKDGAEVHLVEALEEAERDLEILGRTLMQRTYFAVPKEQLTL
jgi:hypothetical protein